MAAHEEKQNPYREILLLDCIIGESQDTFAEYTGCECTLYSNILYIPSRYYLKLHGMFECLVSVKVKKYIIMVVLANLLLEVSLLSLNQDTLKQPTFDSFSLINMLSFTRT